jgi:hypothetical protein
MLPKMQLKSAAGGGNVRAVLRARLQDERIACNIPDIRNVRDTCVVYICYLNIFCSASTSATAALNAGPFALSISALIAATHSSLSCLDSVLRSIVRLSEALCE